MLGKESICRCSRKRAAVLVNVSAFVVRLLGVTRCVFTFLSQCDTFPFNLNFLGWKVGLGVGIVKIIKWGEEKHASSYLKM